MLYFKNINGPLAGWLSWLEHRSMQQKVVGSLRSRGITKFMKIKILMEREAFRTQKLSASVVFSLTSVCVTMPLSVVPFF